ncbi:LLM class flavin-dependent oxidoreductase [Rhodococcus sp. NPDC003383]
MPTSPVVVWFLEPGNAATMLRTIVQLDLAGADAVVLPGSADCPEALLLAAAASRRAPRIGVVAEISPWSQPPFLTARALGTLDALTRGRAGWFVSGHDTGTVSTDDSGRWFAGTATETERQDALADYLAATAALGNSWEPDALIADVPSGRYVDADCVHVTNYHGPYFSTRGPLNAPRPPQGRAVRFAEYREGTAESDVADVLVVRCEEDIRAARASADCVLLRVAGEAAVAPPVTSADGYAFSAVSGRLIGQVLHETLPALVPTPRGGLLRDRFGLSASDFEFVPYHAEQEVSA